MTTTLATIDRLTPFESYMFGEQRDHQPMSFFLRLDLQGPLEMARLHASLASATAQHAMLSAQVIRDAGNRLCWGASEPSHPRVLENSISIPPNTEPIDLESSTGLRVWLIAGDLKHVLWIEVHHACCDGLALVDFLHTWRRELHRSAPATERNDGAGITIETTQQTRRRGVPSMGRITVRQAQRLARFCLPRRILPIGDRSVDSVQRREVLLKAVTGSPSKRARTVQGSPTINDMLIAACFSALGRASRQQASPASASWLRLCVPVNLRPLGEQPQLVANCVSMVFLERRVDQVGSLGEMLASVSREMRFIKRHRIGLCMLHALRAFRCRFRVPEGRCMASAVLSNLGRLETPDGTPWQLGEAQLTAINLVPPLRQFTNIAFGATTFSDQLQLAMHYNVAAISASLATTIFDSFAAQVEQCLSQWQG